MIAQVLCVSDEVFPKPPLPHQSFIAGVHARFDVSRYAFFDLPPTAREIIIPLTQYLK